jgi:hypothetical protein
MDSTTVIRRLAAIVIADVVGYTRLMEHDDTGTYARVRLIRDEVVDPAILSHGGRIVKTAGDGLVAEFTSALAALRASIQIQRQMAVRNQTAIADERIDYRSASISATSWSRVTTSPAMGSMSRRGSRPWLSRAAFAYRAGSANRCMASSTSSSSMAASNR